MAIKHVVNWFIHLLNIFEYLLCGRHVTYTAWAMTKQHAIKIYVKIIWLYFDPLKLFPLECHFSPCPQPSTFVVELWIYIINKIFGSLSLTQIMFLYIYIYIFFFFFFWLHWVFVAVRRLFSSCGERGYSSLRCVGFSLRWLLLLRNTGSRCAGFSSCGTRALEHRLSSCGARALLLRSMWDFPGPGLEPVFPALAGGFLTTAPPGRSLTQITF